MTAPPPHPDGASRIARSLGMAWAEPTLPLALARSAQLLAEVAGAQRSALFLLSEEGILEEAWFPETERPPLDLKLRFQRAALEGGHRDARESKAPIFVTRCAVPSTASPAENVPPTLAWVRDSPGDELAASYLEIVARKVAVERDHALQQARQEQYQRWFKTLDAQLRILDRERQKFAAVANQTDTYAFVTDGSRAVRWMNKAMGSLLGDEDGDWTGRACDQLCSRVGLKEASAPCDACPVMRAFLTNATVHREISDAPGGRELYLTALPIKGPDGEALEVLGQIQDLTNLEVVRRAKERLETVISGAPIILFTVDRDGVITMSEGKGLEALGRGRGEAVGKSAYEVYRNTPKVGEHIRRALDGIRVVDSVEIGDLTFETYYGPLHNPEGAIEGVIGVATDVTEQRRAQRALQESEERLRHAQRIEAVGSLAGGIAHDFNNLLTAMFGHLKFLRRRLDQNPDLDREVGAIEHAANRAASLTRQLLAFSRKQVLQLRVMDLNEIVRSMEGMLRRLIPEDLELVIETDASWPWVRADAGQMEQVLVNLAVNARDAMPKGGRLVVRTVNVDATGRPAGSTPHLGEDPSDPVPPGAYVCLLVRDTGVGMDADTQARAFEPFFTTKPVGEGTGLGLSTVYGIVKQSGGEIFLKSAPEAGASIAIYLPRAETSASVAELKPEPPPALEPGSETILLVEDEAMVRDLFRDILEQAGYTVLAATSGAEALAIAARYGEPIHLMVTDVVMPGMSGGELVHRMAQVRPDVKVIYVSGYTDDVLVRRGVIDSGVPFLQKPCLPDDLARRVRETLG